LYEAGDGIVKMKAFVPRCLFIFY